MGSVKKNEYRMSRAYTTHSTAEPFSNAPEDYDHASPAVG